MCRRLLLVGVLGFLVGCATAPAAPTYVLPDGLPTSQIAWLEEQMMARVRSVDGLPPLRDTFDMEGEERAVALAPGEVTLEVGSPSIGIDAVEEGNQVIQLQVAPGKHYLLLREHERGLTTYWVIDLSNREIVVGSEPQQGATAVATEVWGDVPAASAPAVTSIPVPAPASEVPASSATTSPPADESPTAAPASEAPVVVALPPPPVPSSVTPTPVPEAARAPAAEEVSEAAPSEAEAGAAEQQASSEAQMSAPEAAPSKVDVAVIEPHSPEKVSRFVHAVVSAARFDWRPLYTVYLRIASVDGIEAAHEEVRLARVAPGRHELEVSFRTEVPGDNDEEEDRGVEVSRHLLVLDAEKGADYRLRARVKGGERWVWIEHEDTREVVAGAKP